MESRDGISSSKGVLIPVALNSDAFQNDVLIPLRSAYLYEWSKKSFRYNSAVLIRNPELEKKYKALLTKRRETGYSEQDLKESFGFLLFDDVNKANALGETGVFTGNSTCRSLGDPKKGVYISLYSDCLDPSRWYPTKSGYITIIRLTKGRVKQVLENYTLNFTPPTEGFDCHESAEFPTVSAKTNSFLAFERTQCYLYELLNSGSSQTVQPPSALCPVAIVSFSYTDPKTTLVAPPEQSPKKEPVFHYFLWRGQLQIGTCFYNVGLRSTGGTLIPAELPPVVKVDRAISMLDLRQLLPKTVFETRISSEVALGGLFCSLCELVPCGVEQTHSLSLLLQEIKEKDIALTFPLRDSGFLILLHPSHFLTSEDGGGNVLQGMFVFPDSRVIQRDTKFAHRNPDISSDILQMLPVLTYAESEVKKTPIKPSEELYGVLVQHMQNYAALINPGLAQSPSQAVNAFPAQYDVPVANQRLYSSLEWTNGAWQNLTLYLSKPVSFQLPVSKASEILLAGQEKKMEEDDVYLLLSSPEEMQTSQVNSGPEGQPSGQNSAATSETSSDSCTNRAEDQAAASRSVVLNDSQPGDVKDAERADTSLLTNTDHMGATNLLMPSTSEDLPAELIVSITSAERTHASVITNKTNMKEFQHSVPAAEFQTAGANTQDGETAATKKVFQSPRLANLVKMKPRIHSVHFRGRKHVAKARVETCSLQKVISLTDNEENEQKMTESSAYSQWNNISNIEQRDMQTHKLGSPLKDDMNFSVEGGKSDPGLRETCPLRKKLEHLDIKPVISVCGRILVPHGCAYQISDQIKVLKDDVQSRRDETSPENMSVVASVNAHDAVEMAHESSKVPVTTVDETKATTSTDGGGLPRNDVISHMNTEHCVSSRSADENPSLTLSPESRGDGSMDVGPASPGMCETKGAFLQSQLKSVLRRGKRKTHKFLLEEMTGNASDAESGRVDTHPGMLKSNDAITEVTDLDVGIKKFSMMTSVDPQFAYILGLTPKETSDKMHKSEGRDVSHRIDSSKTQAPTISDQRPLIIQSPLSMFPRKGGRIKTLKKHQGISAEHVKKSWWMHFQTPACSPSEKLKNKESMRNNSDSKSAKGKSNSASSSTDALNLLADLALSATFDQAQPQLDRTLERKPETQLRNDVVTSVGQESVLHTLLRQPAARPIQLPQSPSPSHLVGSSEWNGLISAEHSYSLSQSSSLLLDLSGTPFQVSGPPFQVDPLRGSTTLLQTHQTMNCGGTKTPYSPVEDKSEHNHRTPKHLKKHMMCRRKHRHSRTCDYKDGSIQITKHWKENYDFNRDSRFTNDPQYRTICRALHGPWNFSIQDTSEEVRLIFHMWIGLFYSRSTPRFFDLNSNCTQSEPLEMPCGAVSAPAPPDIVESSSTSRSTDPDPPDILVSGALDLIKEKNCGLDQESVVLDLSQRDPSVEVVTSELHVRKETSVSGEQKDAGETQNVLESLAGLQTTRASQHLGKREYPTNLIDEVNDIRGTNGSKRACGLLQQAGSLDHTDTPALKRGETLSSVQEDILSVSLQPENHQTASRIGQVKADDDVHTSQDKVEARDVENAGLKEETVQGSRMGLSPNCTISDSRDADLGKGYIGELLENKKHLLLEEPEAVSPDKGENAHEDMDCCAVHEDPEIRDDLFSKEDGLDVKDSSVSDPEAVGSLNDQSGPDTVKNHCVTDSNHQALTEPPPPAYSEENAEHDPQLMCAHGSTLTDSHSTQTVAHHVPPEAEPVANEPAAEEDLGNGSCFADLCDQLPPKCDGPDSLKDDITGSKGRAPRVEESPQAEEGENALCDFQFTEQSVNESTDRDPRVPSEMEPNDSEPVFEERAENHVCLVDKTQDQNSASPMAAENTGSLDGSSAKGSIIQRSNSEETGSQHKSNANICLSDGGDWEAKVDEAEQNIENTILKEPFHNQSHLPESGAVTKSESEVALPKGTYLESEQASKEGVTKEDPPREDAVQPSDFPSEGHVEEAQSQKETSSISNSILPSEVCGAPLVYRKKSEQSVRTPPTPPDVSEIHQPEVSGIESDERCPTPTIDEEPYQYVTSRGPISNSSSSTVISEETCKNMTQQSYRNSSILINDTKPPEQTHKSTTNSDRHPDPDPGSQRDEFLLELSSSNKSSQMETADVKHSLDQTDRLQETSVRQDSFHPHKSIPPTECSQAFKPNTEKNGIITTSKTNLSQGLHLFSQQPAKAVKLFKSEEIQTNFASKDGQIQISLMSNFARNKQTSASKTGCLEGHSAGKNDKQEDGEISHKGSWLSNADKATITSQDPLYNKGRDVSPSLPVQSLEFSKPSKYDGAQCLAATTGQTKESHGMDPKCMSDASTSAAVYEDGDVLDDGYLPGNSRITCTIFNTSQKISQSFLEQVSKRCLQEDLTQASVEQECLIFSEKMKQLLKRSKRGPLHQQDAHDRSHLSRSSPVTVDFSGLEEQDEAVDPFDVPSLSGHKIKVDMSERKLLADTAVGKNARLPQKLPEGHSNTREHAGVSGVTADCARLYTTMMNDVCGLRKVPSRSKHLRKDKSHVKTEQSEHFPSCGPVKRKLDADDVNSVVKKSFKTKYRFYMLVTSDDELFEETKAQLEAEGHTAVQPSEFFLDEDRSSSLLIILRNEDIAEHICEVPHLLRLKKSPGVQFAGIDEPNDVVNLTHQELFTAGGFIMFDRAALESLTLCDMKTTSDILRELSRTRKWRWMMHYRDSRRLKGSARLSAGAQEKKRFLNWCQDVGILEVLPYHECDHLSRDQPDYLTCLVHLQLQNISSRYPVFITDATTDGSFGMNGILTFTLNSFLTCHPSETFSA